jgi:Delta7-sterol 5-desaturase
MRELLHQWLDSFPALTAGTTLYLGLRYFILAGVAWLLAYGIFRRRWLHRKIVTRFPPGSEVRREIIYSLQSLLIFGLVGAGCITAAHHGWTQLYWRISDYGWGWFWASVVCAIFLHDAYFYWTHRIMHHPRLFPWFHRVHHLSHNPTPWAAYAFHPLEAVVQAGIFPLAICIMPIHPLAFSIFMFWQIVNNILGHTGYEFYPRWLMNTWLKRFLNTVTNHAMHHEKMRGNYGLYFNFWDRLMGTNHADYEQRFCEVTSRPPQELPRTN